jgi:hypothetical protein
MQSVGLLGRGISPSQGRYPHRTTQTQNKRRQTARFRVGLEPTIRVFKWVKAFHAVDRNATVNGVFVSYRSSIFIQQLGIVTCKGV